MKSSVKGHLFFVQYLISAMRHFTSSSNGLVVTMEEDTGRYKIWLKITTVFHASL